MSGIQARGRHRRTGRDWLVANDEHGIELVNVQGERKDGTRHEWRIRWVCHFRGGRIAESWGQVDDQAALDGFLRG
jgi:ketosteroid isomerase-like protein